MHSRRLIFEAFESTGWLLFCVVVVIATMTAIVMLMRYERRLVRARVGNTLLALRIATMTALLATLLEPVVTWTLDLDRTGRILVAIDLSESMNTADKHASPGEKLRWARSLNMIGNVTIDDRLDRWQAAFDAGEEPPWTDENETADPLRREQLTEVRQENLQGIFAELDKMPRKEIARRLLVGLDSPLLQELQRVGHVELRVFAGKAESSDETTFEQFISDPPTSIHSGTSDLTVGLSAAGGEAETSPLMGVVLLTDGRDNALKNPAAVAARLGELEARVFPILFGSEEQPRDLAISFLEYPQTAFKDDHPLIKATVNVSGFAGEDVTVVLERDGQELQSKTVTADGLTANVEFELEATDVGRVEYTLRTDVRPEETRDDNNRQTFAMNVVDDKARVLLLEGEARWEFRFVDNALQRDERVVAQQVVFQQPYLGVLPESFFPRQLNLPQQATDLASSPFADQDLVIFGDVASASMPPIAWELLEKFVAEAGGTIVFVAGKQNFPLAYRSPIVDRLVPLTNLRTVDVTNPESGDLPPTARGFRLELTREGESEAVLQFSANVEENRTIWSGLPGHMWGVLGEAKPGATVLAHAVLPGAGATLAGQRQNAVIVHQHYGFGQVVWIGIDSTWRWRHRVGDAYHHRFWGQLARWASNTKASAGNEFVKFGPEQSDIDVGNDAVIRARWTQQFMEKFPQATGRVDVQRVSEDGSKTPFTEIVLTPVRSRPLIHEGRLVSLPAGEYSLSLEVQGADVGAETISTALYVHEKQTVELSDLSSNRELLTQIAEAGHGRLFLPDEVHELPAMFVDPQSSTVVREEFELWDHWLSLVVFFTLMMSEWVIRKLNGLP